MKNSEIKKAVITQETMSAVGKEAELAGKKYLIAPISIADMHLVINNVLFLPILDKENVEDINEYIIKALSNLEIEVLHLYMDGKNYKEIAKVLDKAPKSIDNALQRIKKKLEGVNK